MQFAQRLTNAIFTEWERGFGNEILCELDRIQFETLDKRTEAAKFLTDIGALTLDQVLDIFGFVPIGGEEGARRRKPGTRRRTNRSRPPAASRTRRSRKMNRILEGQKWERGRLKWQWRKNVNTTTLQDFTLVPREGEASTYRVRGTAVVFDTPACLYEIDSVNITK